MDYRFEAQVKITMQPVRADETAEARILREQAQARMDAFADRVALRLETMLAEDHKAMKTVDALDKEWKRLVNGGAIRFVEF